MADFRPIDLNTVVPALTDDPFVIVDDSSYTEAQKCSRTNFILPEATDRAAADNAIIDGAGLQADGSMNPIPGSAYLRNQDFAAAGLNVNIINGLKLLDIAIETVSGNLYLIVQANLTSAEILASGTAIPKWVAPGAGLFYHVWECIAKNTFNSVAYTSAGANGLYVRFTSAADYICHLDQTFLQAAATIRKRFNVAEHELPLNTGIEVIAPDGNPTNGDGTIEFILTYLISADFAGAVAGASGCCVVPLSDTFTNADLTGLGNLEINHNLNTQKIWCVIIDDKGTYNVAAYTMGDEAGADPNNYITVSLGAIAGTWTYMIYAIP